MTLDTFNFDSHIGELVKNIILSENIQDSTISVKSGSEQGDGYLGINSAIEITGKNKVLKLFIKAAPTCDNTSKIFIRKAYKNESFFYKTVYPAMLKFQIEKEIKHLFNCVPKCYGTTTEESEEAIIMENLKENGYVLFDRKTQMNDEHIIFVFKHFARFHAVSFAMKDQKRQLYDKLCSNMGDLYIEFKEQLNLETAFATSCDSAVKIFGHVSDKSTSKILQKLKENLIDTAFNAHKYAGKYCIITQGDCWCSNMMFRYEEPFQRTRPCDIKLIDWQLVRVNTPVMDLAYFFYSVASKEAMANINSHLQVYYDALSENIRELGSDPEKLYPQQIFLEHWGKFCKYGLLMSFMILKVMLCEKDEVKTINDLNDDFGTMFKDEIKNQEHYEQRVCDNIEHFIKNKYL